jgi:hypothetical protein
MTFVKIMKIIGAVAQALQDGRVTKDEAKQIVGLVLDLFLPEAIGREKE